MRPSQPSCNDELIREWTTIKVIVQGEPKTKRKVKTSMKTRVRAPRHFLAALILAATLGPLPRLAAGQEEGACADDEVELKVVLHEIYKDQPEYYEVVESIDCPSVTQQTGACDSPVSQTLPK